jgi:hypothetical protein
VFTARYALSPYIKQIRFVFKGLIRLHRRNWSILGALNSLDQDVKVIVNRLRVIMSVNNYGNKSAEVKVTVWKAKQAEVSK